MYYVYVIQNPEGRLYVGYSSDPERRLRQHNDPSYRLTKTTKRIPGPWKLVLAEEFETRSEAMRREKYYKSGAGRESLKQQLSLTCPHIESHI